jgi:hypothetical protein
MRDERPSNAAETFDLNSSRSQPCPIPQDTTRTILSLVCSGSISRMPDIRFIFSHAGGTLPMVAGRIAHYSTLPAFKDKVPNGFDYELKPSTTRSPMSPTSRRWPRSPVCAADHVRHRRSAGGDRRCGERTAERWACAHRPADDRARHCDRLVPGVAGVGAVKSAGRAGWERDRADFCGIPWLRWIKLRPTGN